jgi:hypothetical protein
MNEHPILFSPSMVQANLEDRKTMTRRICKHQTWSYSELHDVNVNAITRKTDKTVSCPYGKPGDLLWVRESFQIAHGNIFFRADGEEQSSVFKWKPSIHMPKTAARIWLQIEEIRVERLNEISEEDAIAEGIEVINSERYGKLFRDYMNHPDSSDKGFKDSILSFRSLFLSINDKPKPVREHGEKGPIVSYTAIAWDQAHFDLCFAKYKGTYRNKPLEVIINPWVWVVKYKVLSKTGKPQMCYKTNEVCKYDCKGLCRESM